MVKDMLWSRRGFLGGMAAFAALSGRTAVPLGGKRWFRGVLHAHSVWSDGHAFPEEAVEWYRSHGYHFLSLTDHNIFQDDANAWVKAQKKFGWRRPTQAIIDHYLKAHPKADVRRDEKGEVSVRLRTYEELRRLYDQPGEFALYPGYEMTHSVVEPDGVLRQVHMNAINVPDLPSEYRAKDFVRQFKGMTASALIGQKRAALEKVPAAADRPHLFIVNHPIWRWYDLGPETLIDNPDVRFFEVCNGGAALEVSKDLPDDGLDTDRFWDIVNAFRARRGQPLLYGIGTDDSHHYDGSRHPMCIPGNAWCRVRADSPRAEDVLPAMQRGDFLACEGLEAEDVSFDRKSGTLRVSVAGAPAMTRKITFIVSKRDFDEKPAKSVSIVHEKDAKGFRRTVNSYTGVGVTVRTVVGKPGEAVSAAYTLGADDLYVRARIESPEPPLCRVALHPKSVCCWTQPYSA